MRRSVRPVTPTSRRVARPELKVWVVFAERVKFGEGRARLLELVDELGSLRQALARIGMSYRSGWGYFRELERAAGTPLIETAPGGRRAGVRLTPAGRALLASWRRFRAGLDAVVESRFRKAFGESRRRR